MFRTFSAIAGAAIIGLSALAASPAQAGGRHHGHFGHVKFRTFHPGYYAGNHCFRQKVFVKHPGFRKVLICR